jgi:AcrR family transcriptional regulator
MQRPLYYGRQVPRVVDHVARRQLVAECAIRLIAERGTDAATVRAVASAAGFSTTVVSHYFTDKRELLMFTYREAAIRTRARVEAALAADATDLRGALHALLPLDADRRRDWRVNFAFWGLAVTDGEMTREQRARVRGARALLADVLRRRGAPDPEGTARRLLTVVIGIAIQAMFDPGDWPRARQLEQLERLAEVD